MQYSNMQLERLQRKFSGIHATLIQQQACSGSSNQGGSGPNATPAIPTQKGRPQMGASAHGATEREFSPAAEGEVPEVGGGLAPPQQSPAPSVPSNISGHRIPDLDATMMMSLTDSIATGVCSIGASIGAGVKGASAGAATQPLASRLAAMSKASKIEGLIKLISMTFSSTSALG